MAWSPAGSLVFNPAGLSQDGALKWVDRHGVSERAPLPNRRYQTASSQMRVSPDGTRVALTILSDAVSGQSRPGQDILAWEIARGTLTRLTFTSRSASPVWTPDGKRLCYASEADLFCQSSDGTGQPRPTFSVKPPFPFTSIGPVFGNPTSVLKFPSRICAGTRWTVLINVPATSSNTSAAPHAQIVVVQNWFAKS